MLDPATWHTQQPTEDAAYKSWQAAGKRAIMRHDPEARTAAPTPTFGSMVHTTGDSASSLNYAPGEKHATSPGKPDIAYQGGEDEPFEFGDVLDIINPLQHLPVIGTVYRKMTGDTMKGFASIIGGALFTGPIGAVSSTANVIVKDRTGKDIAENALAMMGFDASSRTPPKPDVVYAQNSPAAADGAAEELRSASFTAASKAYTSSGHKNFAAVKTQAATWNV